MKSFEKMFNILALFTMNRTELSLSEIEKELGYPKSTVFRILNTLEKFNYIERSPNNHRYRLGFNFFRLGSIVQSQLDIRKVSLPTMKRLVEETNETVELNILDGLSRICVEKVDSPLTVRNFVRVGERKPIHIGASGKVLVAFSPDAEREQIIDVLVKEEKLDRALFVENIRSIQARGYEVTRGERIPDSFAVAAPIFDREGQMAGSLTVAGPILRLTKQKEKELVEKLLKATAEISANLGYTIS